MEIHELFKAMGIFQLWTTDFCHELGLKCTLWYLLYRKLSKWCLQNIIPSTLLKVNPVIFNIFFGQLFLASVIGTITVGNIKNFHIMSVCIRTIPHHCYFTNGSIQMSQF